MNADMVMRQLQAAEEREKAALEREEWLKRQLEEEKERSRELERRMLPPQGKTARPRKDFSRVYSVNRHNGVIRLNRLDKSTLCHYKIL